MKYPASTNLCRARTEMSLMRGRLRMIEAIYTQPKRLRINIAEESRDALAMLRRAGIPVPINQADSIHPTNQGAHHGHSKSKADLDA